MRNFNACDLRQKEVINICTAERLGYITDVEIDFSEGSIRSVIVPRKRSIHDLFAKRKDYIIPWESITCVGDDVVLVKLHEFMENKSTNQLIST